MAAIDLGTGGYEPQPTQRKQSFGNSAYDRIASIFRGYDYEPTQQDVSQWGTDIDDRYLQAIGGAIGKSMTERRLQQQQSQQQQSAPSAPSAQGAPSAPSGGGIFTDPATQRWETAVNHGAGQLLTPQANPDFQPYVDYMRKYFAQLQQPGYTPAQQELIQTQSLDPMERQRTAARDQVKQRMANRNVEGGVVERAMQDVDRQFNEMRTRTQGNFATQQIAMDQQRQGQAAQVGAALSQAQQAMATNDEQRMLQALTLLFSVPQYADTRLQLANQTLQPMNAGNYLNMMNSVNSQNANQGAYQNSQNQQMWGSLGQMLASLFGG